MISYTITEQAGCRIVTGEVPISSFAMLTHGMSEKAVMDPDLARMMGANFAFGEPDDIAKLNADPAIIAQARERTEKQNSPHLSKNAMDWLATGERGMSSDAMFYKFSGSGRESTWTPSDPADFRRCRLLLEQVPEFVPLLPTMAEVSPRWAALVTHWDELSALMDKESPRWREGSGGEPKNV